MEDSIVCSCGKCYGVDDFNMSPLDYGSLPTLTCTECDFMVTATLSMVVFQLHKRVQVFEEYLASK